LLRSQQAQREEQPMGARDVTASSPEAPQYPVGPFVPEDGYGHLRREELIAQIEGATEPSTFERPEPAQSAPAAGAKRQ